MSQPVRAARVAIVAGLLVAVFVGAMFRVRTVPGWAVAMFGGPGRAIDRYGGLSLTFRPAPGTERQFEAYIAERGSEARRGERGSFVVEFPGLPENSAEETIDLLSYGGLVFKEVVDGNNYASEIGEREDVKIEVDQWRPEDGGDVHTDLYLIAFSADAMQAALAGYSPPPGTEIAFEWVEPNAYARSQDPRPYLRSYLVKSEVELDGTMIANAVGSYDPNTNRPTVLLDFDREGAHRFCDLTGRIIGKKLATIVGGRVRSAPIINGRICGGRASITMGGSEPIRQETERDALVAVLKSGAIPPGQIEDKVWKPAANVKTQELLAQAMFGLVAGIVFGLLAFFVVRIAKPTWAPRAPRGDGKQSIARRVLVTALGPFVLLAGAYFTLPGINDVELEHILRREVGFNESVFQLGLTPILTAYLLVELIALAFPMLRWRRHDPKGRVGLGKAVAVLGVAFALLQGYLIGDNYEAMSRFGSELVADNLPVKWLVMASLGAGTMVLVILAGVIREHGLGNGYAVIIGSGAVIALVESHTTLALVGAAGIAVATWALLRWRVDRLRAPTCGITPLNDTGGIVSMLVTLGSLLVGAELIETYIRVEAWRRGAMVVFVMLAIAIPLWSWLFARPKLVEGTTWSAWGRATAVSALVIGAIGVAAWFAAPLDVIGIMLVTAALLDIVDEQRARRSALLPAGILHQPQYVGPLEVALAEVNIPACFHASHVRTLYAFFGPWAPIVVLVPAEHAEAARAIVYKTITKAHHEVARAFARDARPTPVRPLVPTWARTT